MEMQGWELSREHTFTKATVVSKETNERKRLFDSPYHSVHHLSWLFQLLHVVAMLDLMRCSISLHSFVLENARLEEGGIGLDEFGEGVQRVELAVS